MPFILEILQTPIILCSFLVVSLQQRSWLRSRLKALTAQREPCPTSPQVNRLQSACLPLLPAPPPHMASATRRDMPSSAPRVSCRWSPPRLCPLRPRWLGLSPRPDRPPSHPGRDPACLLLSLHPHLALVPSLWSTHLGSWTAFLLGKACPLVMLNLTVFFKALCVRNSFCYM